MESTQIRMMLALSGAMVFVALLLRFWEPSEDPWDEAATVSVWQASPADVTGLSITRGDDELQLQKTGQQWAVAAPYEALANQLMVERLVQDLTRLSVGIEVEGDPEAFGLGDPPVAQITLTRADGTTDSVAIGSESPIANRTYVRVSTGQMTVVQGSFTQQLATPAIEFRDDRVFRFAPGDVVKMSLTSAGGTLVVSGEGHEWWVDGFTRADPQKVDGLALALLDMRVEAFVELDQQPTIDRPVWVAIVTLRNGDTRELVVGDGTPMGQLARLPSGLMVTLNPEALAFLSQGPADIGVEHPFGDSEADSFAIEANGLDWKATHNGADWRRAGFADPETASVVAALSQIRIAYRLEPVPELGPRWATITMGTDRRPDRVVHLGQALGDFRVAQYAGGGAPFLIALSDLASVSALMP